MSLTGIMLVTTVMVRPDLCTPLFLLPCVLGFLQLRVKPQATDHGPVQSQKHSCNVFLRLAESAKPGGAGGVRGPQPCVSKPAE